jgi:hypothetical protein
MRRPAALFVSLAIVSSLSGTAPSAQAVPPQSLDGQVLGWIKIYNYTGATLPITMDHRVYSPAQLSIAQLFANWMQASYLPTGALGDVVQIRNEKLSPYNQNTAALPQRYGAFAKLYTELKYDANKKLTPLSNSHVAWTIEANGFYGDAADALSTPEHYYFTLPKPADELDKADISRHPVLGQFPAYFQRMGQTGNRKYVLLSRDHRLPFVTITKGQYLDALEVAIARKYSAEKKRITEAEQGDEKRIAVDMKDVDARTAKRTAVLAGNREKYRGRLQETAVIATGAPDLMLENYPDVFEGSGGPRTMLPVYTIDPRLIELCKTDAPQWIVMSWTTNLNDPVSRHLHDAILNNVNVQYIYDYFFDPDKVKGQPYKPLRSPSFTEAAVAAAPSAAVTKATADPSVHFFDDFSAGAVGRKPPNWKSTLDTAGASSVVTELQGLDGRWASMSGFRLTPTGLKTPLPRDFEVSYDLVAAQNFTWGAHGLTFKLSRAAAAGKGESFVSLRIRPGFSGREGEVVIEGQFPGAQGYMSGTKYAPAPGFSNDRTNNRITVTLRKKGELVQVFIGKTKVAEYEKGVPPALQFDALSFELGGVSANDKMYIGNIRIATI